MIGRVNPAWFFVSMFVVIALTVSAEVAFGEDSFKVIDAKVYDIKPEGKQDRIIVLIPDGNLHVFYIGHSWDLQKGDPVQIGFRLGRIMDVNTIVPYLMFHHNGTKIIP